MEVVLEHKRQKGGTLDHFLLSGLSWRWGQADEAGDEDGATEDLNKLHFDVSVGFCVFSSNLCVMYLDTDLKSKS